MTDPVPLAQELADDGVPSPPVQRGQVRMRRSMDAGIEIRISLTRPLKGHGGSELGRRVEKRYHMGVEDRRSQRIRVAGG